MVKEKEKRKNPDAKRKKWILKKSNMEGMVPMLLLFLSSWTSPQLYTLYPSLQDSQWLWTSSEGHRSTSAITIES